MTLVGSFKWTRSRSSMSDGSKSQMNCHDDGRDLDSKSYGKRPQRHCFVSRNFHPSTCMQFVWWPKIAVRVDIQTSKENQWTHERTTNLQFCRWKHENTKIDQKCFPSLFNTFPILNGFLFSLMPRRPWKCEHESEKLKLDYQELLPVQRSRNINASVNRRTSCDAHHMGKSLKSIKCNSINLRREFWNSKMLVQLSQQLRHWCHSGQMMRTRTPVCRATQRGER